MEDVLVGSVVKGEVTGVESYGIFVKLDNNYTGLVHISEITERFVKDINNYAKIGEEIYKHYVDIGKAPEHLADNFAVVAASMAAVNDLHKQIADIKVNKLGEDIPKTTCPACKKDIIATAKFCHECGAPVAKKPSLAEEIKEEMKETERIYAEAHAEALATEEYPR